MRLLITLPNRVQVDAEVEKVGAEGSHGSFTMLPRHLDHVVLLEPGILSYTRDGEEHFVAVDGGILVKVGDRVRVATTAAILGDRLDELERMIAATFRRRDERDRAARAALVRFESRVVHELFEFEEAS